MSRFPDPLGVPPIVPVQRRQRLLELIRSSALALSIRSGIVLVELIAVFLFGSASLFMDAVASSVDIVFTILLIVCLKLAERPPDDNHPFGHGRFEPLLGLFVSLALVVMGGTTGIFQALHFFEPIHETPTQPFLWMVPLFAVICLEVSYRLVAKAARKQASPMMEADAAHYRIDSLSSLIATIALLLASYDPSISALWDRIGAFGIALLMIGIGIFTAKKNLYQLLDYTPEEQYFDLVRKAAKKVEGVRDTEKMRIQVSGPDAHVDIDIEVDPNLTVEVAHAISQKVRWEIQQAWPSVRDVTVHIEPHYPGDH